MNWFLFHEPILNKISVGDVTNYYNTYNVVCWRRDKTKCIILFIRFYDGRHTYNVNAGASVCWKPDLLAIFSKFLFMLSFLCMPWTWSMWFMLSITKVILSPSCYYCRRIQVIVVQNKGNTVLELQQRSIEFNSIIQRHKSIK